MPCKKSSRKKYASRDSPPYPANDEDCRGKKKRGNDGTYYVSTVNSRGVYRWIKATSLTKAKKKKASAPRKKTTKKMSRRKKASAPRKKTTKTIAADVPVKVTGWKDPILDNLDVFQENGAAPRRR